MKRALIVITMLATTAPAAAQDHRVSFESEGMELEVHIGETWDSLHHVCTTPCGYGLRAGHYHVGFSREVDLDPLRFSTIDVERAITLRVEWVDRGDLRLAGDVVLIVGITLGALVGGTAFGGFQEGDGGLLALGISGLALVGTSLIIGVPLSIIEDSVQVSR